MIRASLLIALLVKLQFTVAQGKKELVLIGLPDLKVEHIKYVKDKSSATKEARNILHQLFELSYLSASIDSTVENKDKIKLYVNQGDTYKWVKLSKGNITEIEANQIDLSSRLFLNRPFSSKNLTKLYDRAIRHYENNGYPFASISLDSIEFLPDNGLNASLLIKKNKYYKIDSIIVKGNSAINEAYLFQHLELIPGQAYDESKVKNISTRINEIPFIEESKEVDLQFFEKGVKVVLYLKKKNASRFDGILGLLTNEDDGKIEFTGDVDLNLINSFNRGEHIGFNWRKLKGNSQDLNLKLLYPYLLNSPFGLDFNFKLFKRDTTFIDLNTSLGVNYNLKKGEVITIFLANKTSNLLSRNTLVQQINPELPGLGDVNINSFGLAYEFDRYDYRFNPRKGFGMDVSFSVGKKRLKKIILLEEEFPNIYDGIKLKTTHYNSSIKVDYYLPIGKRSTIKIANQSTIIYAGNIYQNELSRIGGLKILRGFDEESINASGFSIFSLEYRFLLDRNSYFSLFSDGGYYENKNVEDNFSDTPIGIGAGINFETGAGIFSFNYAVGKQFGNPIEFRAAKIHFGFVNLF